MIMQSSPMMTDWRIYIPVIVMIVQSQVCARQTIRLNQIHPQGKACKDGKHVRIHSLRYSYIETSPQRSQVKGCQLSLSGKDDNRSRIEDDTIFKQCSGRVECEFRLSNNSGDLPKLPTETCNHKTPNALTMEFSCIRGAAFMDMCSNITEVAKSFHFVYTPDSSQDVADCSCNVYSNPKNTTFQLSAVDAVVHGSDSSQQCGPLPQLRIRHWSNNSQVFTQNYSTFSGVNQNEILQNLSFIQIHVPVRAGSCQVQPRQLWWKVETFEGKDEKGNLTINCSSVVPPSKAINLNNNKEIVTPQSSRPTSVALTQNKTKAEPEPEEIATVDRQGGLLLGAVIGGVAGGLLLLLIIITVIIFLRRRQQSKYSKNNYSESESPMDLHVGTRINNGRNDSGSNFVDDVPAKGENSSTDDRDDGYAFKKGQSIPPLHTGTQVNKPSKVNQARNDQYHVSEVSGSRDSNSVVDDYASTLNHSNKPILFTQVNKSVNKNRSENVYNHVPNPDDLEYDHVTRMNTNSPVSNIWKDGDNYNTLYCVLGPQGEGPDIQETNLDTT